MNKSIAVLLTVHDRKQKTLACLKRLFEQTLQDGYELDVYLTDDGCTDGTPEAIREQFPQVNIINGDGNLFWNRGMYKAWEAAAKAKDYDFYLWLNDDTILLPGALEGLLNEAEEKPDSVIVGPTHSTTDEKKLSYSGYVSGDMIYPIGNLQKCETFNGNIVLVSKAIYHLIGNLDLTYQHAIGDVDYGWMVTRSGNSNYVSREFRGICNNDCLAPIWTRKEVPFRKRWKNFHSPLGYAQPGSMFYYNRKNFGITRAIRVWLTNHIIVFFPWIKK